MDFVLNPLHFTVNPPKKIFYKTNRLAMEEKKNNNRASNHPITQH